MINKIRELITNGWCQGANARNSKGEACSFTSDEAVCFCLNGAVLRTESDHTDSIDIFKIFNKVQPRFIMWQDSPNTTKKDVLEFLDKVEEIASAVTNS